MVYRVPDSFIEDLLTRLDIVDIVGRQVPLRKSGANYVACCPFHSEKTPSFAVNAQKQFYYCFGCHAHGDGIQFLIEFQGLSFIEAVETLSAELGIPIPLDANQRTEVEKESRLLQLTKLVASFYQQQLREHSAAQHAITYLKARGISGKIAKTYGLGFAPPGWHSLSKNENFTDEQIEDLKTLSLIIPDQSGNHCYDKFRNRIMFPIYDKRGRILGFGGRVFTQEEPKYLNSAESMIFNKGQELYGLYQVRAFNKTYETLIVVEGYLDVITLSQFGIHNVVATLGTALTEAHVDTLFKVTSDIVFCFDGDKAGQEALKRALHLSLEKILDGRRVRFMCLANTEDPDSLIRKIGTQRFLKKIDESIPLGEYIFKIAMEPLQLHHAEDRVKLATVLKPLLMKIPGNMFRQMLLEKLASITGIAPEQLIDKRKSNFSYNKKQVPATRALVSPAYKATALLLHRRSLVHLVHDSKEIQGIDIPGINLFCEIVNILQQNLHISQEAIVEQLKAKAIEAMEIDKMQATIKLIPEEGMEQEFIGNLNLLFRRASELLTDNLLKKAQEENLSPSEKIELKALLQKLQTMQSAVA